MSRRATRVANANAFKPQKINFSHRRAEEEVHDHYVKKAAGPYNPWARYKGPENIALRNGYVRRASGKGGLLQGDKIEAIDAYLSHYGVCRAIGWVVERFRFRKNEELELLATVDFAALELKQGGTQITVATVKSIIGSNTDWKPKLDRAAFSDDRIEAALEELRSLFPLSYVS
jgi:type I restriction enzyme S subunit